MRPDSSKHNRQYQLKENRKKKEKLFFPLENQISTPLIQNQNKTHISQYRDYCEYYKLKQIVITATKINKKIYISNKLKTQMDGKS